MGNKDGIIESLYDTNIILAFRGGYYSFAHGNEIAFILNSEIGMYFILNCNKKLWEKVNKIPKSMKKKERIKFWIKESKKHKISSWSNDFDILKKMASKNN